MWTQPRWVADVPVLHALNGGLEKFDERALDRRDGEPFAGERPVLLQQANGRQVAQFQACAKEVFERVAPVVAVTSHRKRGTRLLPILSGLPAGDEAWPVVCHDLSILCRWPVA